MLEGLKSPSVAPSDISSFTKSRSGKYCSIIFLVFTGQ